MINKVPDGEHGFAVFEVLLAVVVLMFSRRGLRRALTPSENPGRLSVPILDQPGLDPVADLEYPVGYGQATLRTLRIAETLTPLDCVTRGDLLEALQADDDDGIWTRWMLHHRVPTLVDDVDAQVLAVCGLGDDVAVLVLTAECLDVIQVAERLTRHNLLDLVQPGHLAAAVIASHTTDADQIGELLEEYLGAYPLGFETALRLSDWPPPTTNDWPPPTGGSLALAALGGPTPAISPRVKSDPSAIGRFAYPAVAALILLAVSPLFAELPGLISDAGRLADAEAALLADEYGEAELLFDDIARRHPDSFRVHAGRACVASQQGDDQAWAAHVQVALLAGMPWHQLSHCRTQEQLRGHVVIRTTTGIWLTVQADGSRPGLSVRTAASPSRADSINETVAASCANGAAGFDDLALSQAFAVLSMAASVGLFRETATKFEGCIAEWPESARTNVERWISQ